LSFQAKLKDLRTAAGLSQAGLSEQSGIPLGTIRLWEQGHREPSYGMLVKLAKGLGVSLSAFDVTGEPPAEAKPVKRKKGKA
jgi:transcriptional regulator with XRE-family HTH domain